MNFLWQDVVIQVFITYILQALFLSEFSQLCHAVHKAGNNL